MTLFDIIKTDWHKIVVVILALLHMRKFINKHIRSLLGKGEDKSTRPMTITLPPEGCIITIKPLDKIKSPESL